MASWSHRVGRLEASVDDIMRQLEAISAANKQTGKYLDTILAHLSGRTVSHSAIDTSKPTDGWQIADDVSLHDINECRGDCRLAPEDILKISVSHHGYTEEELRLMDVCMKEFCEANGLTIVTEEQ